MSMKLSDPVLLKSITENPGYQVGKTLAAGQRTTFHMMRSVQFELRTIEEAEALAQYLANFFPEPERVVQGIAELMINAIEHGNLEIDSAAKAEFCRRGIWQREIQQRLASPNYADRKVDVVLSRKNGGIYIIVTDEGKGFDWKSYLKINPARATETHGRGIAMANSINFDKLTYNEIGNKAVAYVADTSQFEW